MLSMTIKHKLVKQEADSKKLSTARWCSCRPSVPWSRPL